tara:strand:- start:133 stop:312 length:180 start_codon:yes stop_codon:yes gene_type:complete
MANPDYNLTKEELFYNLNTYGVKHPIEFAPDPADEPAPGHCICGEKNCPDEYAHWTSGY